MSDPRTQLDELIDCYLDGDLDFTAFQQAYSRRYVDEGADRNFSGAEVDHYGVVHEKAEWTAISPTLEDRSYGWIDPSEFKTWLTIHESHKPPRQLG